MGSGRSSLATGLSNESLESHLRSVGAAHGKEESNRRRGPSLAVRDVLDASQRTRISNGAGRVRISLRVRLGRQRSIVCRVKAGGRDDFRDDPDLGHGRAPIGDARLGEWRRPSYDFFMAVRDTAKPRIDA